jgi:hypothetical protein
MQNYNLHGHRLNLNDSDKSFNPQLHVFKLGLDVDLNNIVTAIQCDHGEIKPARKFSRSQLVAWVREKESQRWPSRPHRL